MALQGFCSFADVRTASILDMNSLRYLSRSLPRPQEFSTLINTLRQRGAPVDFHPEVEHALATDAPVVALETTLVTHGFPYPINLELSQSLEEVVRSTGSIPATIGIIGGRIKIGLESKELERLADTKRNPSVVKISRRDIAPAIVTKADGGTTCSATLIFSALAGIKVFATGGLGGVHRGGEKSMDISADLQELTRCPVGLISAGVKSILDIGRTLEYLETLGVPVLSYGKTKDFPAFFSPRSGFKAPWNISDPLTAAKILHTHWQLGMENGALIAVPIPEQYESIGATIQKAVDQAVAESEENGVSKRGKEATPWLLERIGELTMGESLTSNIALLKNTALVGGQIAVQHAKVSKEHEYRPPTHPMPSFVKSESAITRKTNGHNPLPPANLVVIGSAAVDISAKADPSTVKSLTLHSTSPGTVSLSLGGVGRNIAEASHRVMTSRSEGLTSNTLLVSSVGNDSFGQFLVDETQKLGMRSDGLLQTGQRTAVCNIILDGTGSLISGIADMGIIEALDKDVILQHIKKNKPTMVVLDGNLTTNTISSIVTYCNEHNIVVFFEPTSVIKSTAILPAVVASMDKYDLGHAPVAFSSPNTLELVQMYNTARTDPFDLTAHPYWWRTVDSFSLGSDFRTELEQLARQSASNGESSKGTLSFLIDNGIVQMAVNLLPFFQHLIIKCGELGVIVVMRISGDDVAASSWAQMSSDVQRRYIVAKGKSSSQELVVVQHFPALAIETVVSSTGAGDSFVGALAAKLVQRPKTLQDPETLMEAISTAQRAAIFTLQSPLSVSPLLSNMAN